MGSIVSTTRRTRFPVEKRWVRSPVTHVCECRVRGRRYVRRGCLWAPTVGGGTSGVSVAVYAHEVPRRTDDPARDFPSPCPSAALVSPRPPARPQSLDCASAVRLRACVAPGVPACRPVCSSASPSPSPRRSRLRRLRVGVAPLPARGPRPAAAGPGGGRGGAQPQESATAQQPKPNSPSRAPPPVDRRPPALGLRHPHADSVRATAPDSGRWTTLVLPVAPEVPGR